MFATQSAPRRLAPVLASCALLGAAVPAGASAGLRLTARPDPDAPVGKAPKVEFRITGVEAGKRYRVSAQQISGENPLNEQGYPVVCASLLGRLIYERAPSSTLTLTPTVSSYEIGSTRPCHGTFAGKVEKRGAYRPKQLATFRILMPSMRITHFKRPGR
jgi:hypothetical protein